MVDLNFGSLGEPLPPKVVNSNRNDWNVPIVKKGKLTRTVNEYSDKSIAISIDGKIHSLPTSKVMWSGGNKAMQEVEVYIPKAIWDKREK